MARASAMALGDAGSLSTPVQDPAHPGEPWTVTTFQEDGEDWDVFIMRHKGRVERVRKLLQKKS